MIFFFHVLQQIGRIIDNNPEEYRETLVSHEGKKELIVEVSDYDKKNTKIFIEEICKQMKSHVKDNVVSKMTTSYSTTSQIDRVMNSVACMTNMRHYFTYTMSVKCGIRSIYFGGSVEDWIKLRDDIKAFENYGDQFKKYVDGLIPILDEFILARQGKPDIGFFNKIFRKDASIMYKDTVISYFSSSNNNYITGWFLDLYFDGQKKYDKCIPTDFVSNVSTCPFTLILRGVEYKKTLATACLGVQYHKEQNAYSLIKGWSAGGIYEPKNKYPDFF